MRWPATHRGHSCVLRAEVANDDFRMTRALQCDCVITAWLPRSSEVPVTDLGELMTTESYRTAVRPLVLTVAWFVFLAGAAFAWAAIENQSQRTAAPKTTTLVLKH
jgi:hypothetical protein